MQRMTRKCHDGVHYRVPLNYCSSLAEIRITCAPHGGPDIFGDPIDVLGKYEDLGYTPKELAQIIESARRYNLLPKSRQ